MDTMLANATNGIRAMPPKGACAACTEADLKAAIEYIVSESQ
jgi:cytochrome c5